jgi:hypothetical protein
MEVCIFGVLTVNLLTPILIFSFQSASFSWQASYIKTDKCLILRQIRGLNDEQQEASMMPHEGAINASRRKNWCVATEIILRRDAKNNASRRKKQPFYSHFSSYRDAFLIFSTGKL